MNTRRGLSVLILGAVLLLVAGVVARQWLTAQPASLAFPVQLGDDYRLTGTYEGDLVVVAGTIVLAPGSRVTGDASFVGDRITIEGAIDGDLTTIGDSVTLGSAARVAGDAALMSDSAAVAGQVGGDLTVNGDSLTLEPQAFVSGTVTPCADVINRSEQASLTLVSCDAEQQFAPFDALLALRNRTLAVDGMQLSAANGALLVLILSSLGLVGFSALAVTMFPRQISHIEEAIRSRPRSLVGAGFATFLLIVGLGAALIVLLAVFPPVGLVLLPVYAFLGLALLGLVVAGLVTLSLVLGDWLLHRAKRYEAPPLVTAAVGSLALSALLTLVALLPFGVVISLLAAGAVSSVGVGAALFTRLGTRPMRRSYFIQG